MRNVDRLGSRNLPPAIPPAVRAGDDSELSPINSIALPDNLPPAIPLDRIRSVQDSVLTRRGDILQIASYSSLVATIQIITRTYVNGEISVGTKSFATDGTRLAQTITIALTDGLLIGVQLLITSGTAIRGQIFCKGIVLQGSGTSQTQIGIISNYVTTNNQISYPTSPLISSREGSGVVTKQTGAGNSVFYTVPTNTVWKFISAELDTILSANAGNRYGLVQAVINPAASFSRVILAPSNSYNIVWGDFAESTAAFLVAPLGGNFLYVKFPNMLWQATESINVALINPQAGDISSSVFVYEELLDI